MINRYLCSLWHIVFELINSKKNTKNLSFNFCLMCKTLWCKITYSVLHPFFFCCHNIFRVIVQRLFFCPHINMYITLHMSHQSAKRCLSLKSRCFYESAAMLFQFIHMTLYIHREVAYYYLKMALFDMYTNSSITLTALLSCN